MSDRKASSALVRFVPVAPRMRPVSVAAHLLFGVLYPASVVAIELIWRICADSLFDPMPTAWHATAVILVPLANLLAVVVLTKRAHLSLPHVAVVNGAAIAVAAFYALLFLPLYPLAIIAIPMGLGLLPLAPLSSFISALLLRRAISREAGAAGPGAAGTGRRLALGLVGGLAVLLALDMPSAATRLGLGWAASPERDIRERGVRLIRNFGDRDLLLRLCYDTTARPTGLLSAFILIDQALSMGSPPATAISSTDQAREIYYRVTGEAFNVRPVPLRRGRADRFMDFAFDNDHGGTHVGGRIQGLTLSSSRIDGSVAADDAVAYLEWTFEFKNTSFLDREARVQLALPPGAVVSRATLWVNGEEREAAYGARGAVRAAYQRVAVQQRRDPLLVTTKGADRVLAQAFPVARNGGTIRFKLGMTAPLDISDAGKARLVLPAILDRNFSFAGEAPHAVWIDSKRPLAVSAPGLAATHVSNALHRVSGLVPDMDFAKRRVTIVADRQETPAPVLSRIGDGPTVIQDSVVAANRPAGALLIVVDGSIKAQSAIGDVIASLDAIPETARVGMIIASPGVYRMPVGGWTAARKREVIAALAAHVFSGGEDNTDAIADALTALETEADAHLLWVHAPQPVDFAGAAQRLEQATARLSRLPRVTLYATEPGPNELLPDAAWGWDARSLPATGSPERDLGAYVRDVFYSGPRTQVRRRTAEAQTSGPRGSDHIARLWAAGRVLELMRAVPADGKRDEAVALAAEFRLVTPVSGAVVLETAKQFEEANLRPVSPGTVPTVPEPHEWALMLLAAVALGVMGWHNRARIGAAA